MYAVHTQGCHLYPILRYSTPFRPFVPHNNLYPWGTRFCTPFKLLPCKLIMNHILIELRKIVSAIWNNFVEIWSASHMQSDSIVISSEGSMTTDHEYKSNIDWKRFFFRLTTPRHIKVWVPLIWRRTFSWSKWISLLSSNFSFWSSYFPEMIDEISDQTNVVAYLFSRHAFPNLRLCIFYYLHTLPKSKLNSYRFIKFNPIIVWRIDYAEVMHIFPVKWFC